MENELVKVIQETAVEKTTADLLLSTFEPMFKQAKDWAEKSKSLVVTDESQVALMLQAGEARKALKQIRIAADKRRKELKEDSLRYGRAVQGVYNVIEFLIVPIEKHLEEQEKFIEIQEAKRQEQLNSERLEMLQSFAEFVPMNMNYGAMTEDQFSTIMAGAKAQHNAKLEAERRAEAERIEREKAEAAERERIRQENERLKKEAEERERKAAADRKAFEEQARKEREAADKKLAEERAKAEAERKERERIQAEIKAKEDAERREREAEIKRIQAEEKARQEAEKKAAAAPDKEKLFQFSNQLFSITVPEMKTEAGKSIVNEIAKSIRELAAWIKSEANNM